MGAALTVILRHISGTRLGEGALAEGKGGARGNTQNGSAAQAATALAPTAQAGVYCQCEKLIQASADPTNLPPPSEASCIRLLSQT